MGRYQDSSFVLDLLVSLSLLVGDPDCRAAHRLARVPSQLEPILLQVIAPPSTITTSPFMKELRSLTMNAANSASSAGRPRRPLEAQKSCICKSLSGSCCARSVSKIPAAIALTLTPKVPASRERHLVKPIIAAFEVA